MEILIRNGANVNEKSFGGYARVRLASGDGIHREYSLTEFTPLHYAAMFLTDDIDILEMLTDNGADVDAQANYAVQVLQGKIDLPVSIEEMTEEHCIEYRNRKIEQ